MKEYKNHTFVVTAYKESKYLEECIKSLKNQTVTSNIIMSTSTPNDYIKGLAQKYEIELYINTGERGIGQDWNFGISNVKTDYVTVAHQDDIYKPNYLEEIVNYLEKGKDFVIAFTDYREIKNGEEIPLTKNLKIKKILLFPLRFFKKSKFIKRRTLSLGSPICCPSVTVNKKITGENPYKTELKCDLDWDTWDKMAKYKANFLYIHKELMCHRIHEESETSNLIENNIRLEEDLLMLKRYWPGPIAKFIMKFYKKAVKTNEM
ncbi:MAG: glycosyltransferase family 2 protein [Clostridia bacterium]|nr:glycosyltransferase family 2 protein [Clostridia bacterium]